MKNILFLTVSSMDDINRRGIYTDLVRAIANKGLNVYIVSPHERRLGLATMVENSGNIKSLKVRTGNITKVGLLEKGFSTLTIEKRYKKAIESYFKSVQFDLIMYSTPPITFERLIRRLKKQHRAKAYLMLKDIFPQNAVDMGMMRKNGLFWRYFRYRETNLYRTSDVIGCMSPANVEYILEKNPEIERRKVELFPNAIEPISQGLVKTDRRYREKYNIPIDSTLFVYGGNLGKPQGVDFLVEVMDNFGKVKNSHLLVVGSGTEYGRLEEYLQTAKPNNVSLHKYIPKREYDELMTQADVGLIFLDSRFTIPNFPSRLTAYMEASLPIIAATDVNTDLKDVLFESNSGFWSESSDIDTFIEHANRLAQNKELRIEMGNAGRKYLEKNYDVRKTVDIILKHL